MLFQIFVAVPSLVMTTIAWYIHIGLVLTCLIVLFAVAIGAITAYRVREDDPLLSRRPRPKLVPGA
jgi:uncharacterized membrane protein YdbT with pleckstrin-like domain